VVINPDGPSAQAFREITERMAAQISIRARSVVPLEVTQ
jgi:hypothetical protein